MIYGYTVRNHVAFNEIVIWKTDKPYIRTTITKSRSEEHTSELQSH